MHNTLIEKFECFKSAPYLPLRYSNIPTSLLCNSGVVGLNSTGTCAINNYSFVQILLTIVC